MANPKDFYTRLTKLFRSGPSVRKKIKRIDTDSYYDSSLLRNNLGYRAGSPFGREASPFSVLGSYGLIDRFSRYSEFVEMEQTAEVATALDIWADEIVASDDRGRSLHIFSDNAEIKRALEELFYETVNVEFNLRPWVRNLCKFGDFFLYNEVTPEHGVINVQPIPVDQMERQEGYDPSDPYAFRFKWLTHGGKVLERWQVSHFRILGNDFFLPYGACHAKGTKVLCVDGVKEIQDVVPGDKVISLDIETGLKIPSNVLGMKASGVKEVFEIRTRHNQLRTSAEHRILTVDRDTGEKAYKSTSDLRVGDLLFVSKRHNVGKAIKINKTPPEGKNFNGYWNTITNIPDVVTPDFSRLFGFLIGDGWLSNNTVAFANGVCENQNQFYRNLLEKFSSGRCRVNYNKPRLGYEDKTGQTVISSKMLKTIIQRLGFKGSAKTKRIPSWVFSASREVKEAFVRGLNDADGSSFVDKWGCERFQIELSNKELIEDLKTLIQSLGYKTGKIGSRDRRFEQRERDAKIQSSCPSWYFYWFQSENRQVKKFRAYEDSGVDIVTEPIISIENSGSDETFDIHVDHKDHNFFANGICTHNSILDPARRAWHQLGMLEDAMLVYRIVRCLHGDSAVWTEHGYKKIKDIQIGEKVYSYDHESGKLVLSPVTDWVNNGSQKIWSVKTKHRFLKTNASHPILVRDKKTGTFSYVETRHLIPKLHQIVKPTIPSTGSRIPLKLETDNEIFAALTREGISSFRSKTVKNISEKMRQVASDHTIPYVNVKQFLYGSLKGIKGVPAEKAKAICKDFDIEYNKETILEYPKKFHSKIKCNLPEFVSEDFARLFGFLIGDGSLGKKNHRVCFATGMDQNTNEYYQGLLATFTGRSTFTKDKRSVHEQLGAVNSYNFYFAHLLEQMGLERGAHHKRIPSWVFLTSNSIKEAFLMGLVDADGHTRTQRKTESFEVELCNEDLVRDVKELVHQLGWNVSSKLYKRTRKARKILGQEMKCDSTTSISVYFTKVPSDLYEEVLEVQETEEVSDVFDIRVANDLHNFIADGVVVHNSPERRVFYVDVGNTAPNDVPSFMEAARSSLTSKSMIERQSGRQDQRWNPVSILEDYYIPKRGNVEATKIETLQGASNATAIEDVEYIQNKLFAALKIPKAYLGYVDSVGGKATLAQQDIRFSRSVEVYQKMVIAELNNLAILHLYAKGFDGEDLINFDLKLSNPSSVAVMQKLDLWDGRFNIAGTAKESRLVDESWIRKNLLGLTNQEIAEIEIGLRRDQIRQMELEDISAPDGDQQAERTVDPFDPAGYVQPNVEKEPSTQQLEPTQIPVLPRPSSQDGDTAPVYTDTSDGYPISASPTPILDKNRKDRDRRVNSFGRISPDIHGMLSAKNRDAKDPYDMEFLRNPLRKEGVSLKGLLGTDSEQSIRNALGIKPTLPKSVQSILDGFDHHFNLKTQVLSEEEGEEFELDLLTEGDDSLIQNLLLDGVDDEKDELEQKIEEELENP